MRRLGLTLIAAAALIGAVASIIGGGAQGQGITRLCVQVVGAQGQNNCIDTWAPKLLNGLSSVTQVKSGAAVLGTVYCYNPAGAVAYIQIFDAASPAAVTLGTTMPKLSLGIPSALASGTGPTDIGVGFLTGIQVASTTSATGSSTSSMDCNVTFN